MLKTAWLSALAAVFLLALPANSLARDAFVGTWKLIVTPDEEARSHHAKEFNDVATFKGSQFKSAEFEKKGFPATTYDEDTRGGVMATFACEMKSTKGEGKAVWTGTSTGVDMTGELTWTKADGTELKYTVKGTKEQ